ncbi:helix-turn-helix domain-containing protein [Microbacterium thalli]|uniref:Helix-turn-helix transcriptional regulator n=1 Tax=Microbacterium thalli TaxID=3027921 RepID=A0ABT5SD98_9MICO|nr:helix-turn-helix transcriptional regulator [Microbacterium thalli]MDD7960780.1 helix-turn-helix transcriptional regulator [Microbacterium thalli]
MTTPLSAAVPPHLALLGGYLRARRNIIQPEDVGLERLPGRRVPGLRRDEVAALAGISAEYYLRLEQGRGARPSDQVLGAIGRVFGLDAEARAYMHRLASGMPSAPPIAPGAAGEQIARVLAQWTHTPAYMSDAHRDIVAANPLATVFGGGGLAAGNNQIASLFSDENKTAIVEWEEMARAAVATLRRDAHPASPRLAQLVAQLSLDPDFARMWARHDVSEREDARFHIAVEGIGVLEVEGQNFGVRSLPGYQLTVLSGAPGSVTETVFGRLAASLALGGTTRASQGAGPSL